MIKELILIFLTLISILLVFDRYLSKKKLRDYEKRYQFLYIKYKDVESNNQYVENVNLELKKRIHNEKHRHSQKDYILIQQSRLAAMGEMIASIGYQWRQPLNNLSLLIQDVSEAQEFAAQLRSPPMDVETQLVSRDLATKLLARLSAEDRLVLTLLDVEGFSVAEIAEMTNWSISKVKVRAHRARANLRRVLQRYL